MTSTPIVGRLLGLLFLLTCFGLLVACAPEVVTEVLAIFLQEGFDHATVIGEIGEGKPQVSVLKSQTG